MNEQSEKALKRQALEEWWKKINKDVFQPLANLKAKIESINLEPFLTPIKEIAIALDAFRKLQEEARKRAQEILDSIEDYSIQDVYEMPPIDGFTLMEVICLQNDKHKAAAERLAESIVKENDKARASKGGNANKEKNIEPDKHEAYDLWSTWQVHSEKYKNKTNFDESVAQHLNRSTKAVRAWRRQFERGEYQKQS